MLRAAVACTSLHFLFNLHLDVFPSDTKDLVPTARRFLINKDYPESRYYDMGGWMSVTEGYHRNKATCWDSAIAGRPLLAYSNLTTATFLATNGKYAMHAKCY